MLSMRFAALTALLLLSVAPGVRAQAVAADPATPCSGSDPEPARSGMWRVAFCNRTGHDLVLEFRDNDCPAQDWSHRGDVYRRSMRRDESTVFPLCYANERQAGAPAPGIPQLRMPGGKGVVTTWSIVGDCGEHSTPLFLDARTFYDRGDYQNGITLLQHPPGAAHCAGGAVGTSPSSPPAPSGTTPGAAAPAPVATPSTSKPVLVPSAPPAPTSLVTPPATAPPAPAVAPVAAPAPQASAPASSVASATAPPAGEGPRLYAKIDSKDIVSRSVQVYGSNGSADVTYQCSFTLVLGFSDGGSYQDHVKSADLRPGQEAVVITRKYFKSVVKVDLAAQRCTPQ